MSLKRRRGTFAPLFKTCILGDSGVGKTALLDRFVNNRFQSESVSTIGCEYKEKKMQLQSGKDVRVQIWDTAG